MIQERNIRNDLFGFGLLALIVFLSAALFTHDPADPVPGLLTPFDKFYQADQLAYPANESTQNACGQIGAATSDLLFSTLGYGAFYLLVGLASLGYALIRNKNFVAPWLKTIGWVFSLAGITTLCAMLVPNWSHGPIIGSGGYLGALTCGLLQLRFAFAGGLILATATTVVGLMLWTDYLVIRLLRFAFVPLLAIFGLALPNRLLKRIKERSQTDEGGADAESVTGPRFKSAGRQDDLSYDEDEEDDDDEEELDEEETPTLRVHGSNDADEDEEEELDEDEEDVEDLDDAEIEPTAVKTAAKKVPLFGRKKKKKAKKKKMKSTVVDSDPIETNVPKTDAETNAPVETAPNYKVPASKPPSERERVMQQLDRAARTQNAVDYDLPSIEMLSESPDICFESQKKEALRKAKVLEKTFSEFGFKVKVVEIETGPVIAQYEIQLEAGLRLSKITGLSDDLAIALRVPSVRIVAPIPGKNTVGIEVPNENRQIVRLREVIEQAESKSSKMKIPLFLGKDVRGEPMVADLASLPHLLIAGRTGTGKSVCLNAIISSILMTRRPDEVRMLMIDPKMVELSGYGRLPHLMHPVVTDMKKAEAILAWAVDKMEERYTLLAKAGVRHVSTYNQLGEEELLDRLQPENEEERRNIPISLPFIVIVADEMADLMMTAGKDVEQHIIRLAQKSRAVGIHLILATQKPTVDVITGLIKSNLPARIAFQVASRVDSQVVLDSKGSEKLLGNGDMLFLWPGTSTLIRGQGTYLSDNEIDAITESVSTGEQNFVHELLHIKVEDDKDKSAAADSDDRDEFYVPAVEKVIGESRGSLSMLQRAFKIGYGRAARLIDYMEEDGIVGPYAGSSAREVLMTLEQWHQMRNGAANPELESAPEASPPPMNSASFIDSDDEKDEQFSAIAGSVANLATELPKEDSIGVEETDDEYEEETDEEETDEEESDEEYEVEDEGDDDYEDSDEDDEEEYEEEDEDESEDEEVVSAADDEEELEDDEEYEYVYVDVEEDEEEDDE